MVVVKVKAVEGRVVVCGVSHQVKESVCQSEALLRAEETVVRGWALTPSSEQRRRGVEGRMRERTQRHFSEPSKV